MNHTHRCMWCDSDYPGVTPLVEGEDDNGRYRAECECPSTEECPDCAEIGKVAKGKVGKRRGRIINWAG